MFASFFKTIWLVVSMAVLAQVGLGQLSVEAMPQAQETIATTSGATDTNSLEPLPLSSNVHHDGQDEALRPILRANTRCRFVRQKHSNQRRFHLFMGDFGLDGETWCRRMQTFIGLNCWNDDGGKRKWGEKMRSVPNRNAFEFMRCVGDGEDTLTGEKGHVATFELHRDGKTDCERDRDRTCQGCNCPKGVCKKKGERNALGRCVEDAIVKAMPGLLVEWLGEGDHCYKVDRDVSLPV